MTAYREGLTLNPCIICNRHIKFGALLDAALDMGCDLHRHRPLRKDELAGRNLAGSDRGEDPARPELLFVFVTQRGCRARSFRWRAG